MRRIWLNLYLSCMVGLICGCSQFKPELSTEINPASSDTPTVETQELKFNKIQTNNTPSESIKNLNNINLFSAEKNKLKFVSTLSTSSSFDFSTKSWSQTEGTTLEEANTIHIQFSDQSFFNLKDNIVEFKLPSMEDSQRFEAPFEVLDDARVINFTEGLVTIEQAQEDKSYVLIYSSSGLKARSFEKNPTVVGPCSGNCLAWGIKDAELFYMTKDTFLWERTSLKLTLLPDTKYMSGLLTVSSVSLAADFDYLYIANSNFEVFELSAVSSNEPSDPSDPSPPEPEEPQIQYALSPELIALSEEHCVSCHPNTTQLGWWNSLSEKALIKIESDGLMNEAPPLVLSEEVKQGFYDAIDSSVLLDLNE